MSEKSQENNASDPPPPAIPVDLTWEALTGRNNGPGREEWPDLVGLPAEEAEKKIKEKMGGVKTHVVPQNAYVTMDFRMDRVRLFVDGAGKVTRPPHIG